MKNMSQHTAHLPIGKLLAAVLCLTLLFVCISGCGKSSGQSPDTGSEKNLIKVTLNEVAHSIFYAPMYVALEEGYFAEEGIDLELITGFGAVTLV